MTSQKNRIFEIYFSLNVLVNFLSNYFLLFFKNRNIHTIYLYTLINLIKPKVIITSICNSGKFHELAKLLNKKVFFLAVQNASRSSDFRRDLHRYKKKITNIVVPFYERNPLPPGGFATKAPKK